jgi:uncharacterized protein (TIGR00255 family)
MTLKSMTGFARSDGATDRATWHWEVRSVNGRGLDVRLRLPPGYESLEPAVRESLSKRAVRGSITVNLRADRQRGEAEVRLNETALTQAIDAAERVREMTGAPAPTAEGLLALKGVLEVIEQPEDERETAALHAAMMASFHTALDQFVAARAAEGARLKIILEAQIAEIERLVKLIETAPGRQPEAIKARLKELIGRLLDTGSGLDSQRLHQEALLIATRNDVEEELKRLKAHIEAAREILSEPNSVGRKLDFLAQEFNREANTLTSKSQDAEISRLGMALKVVIDQMREQVQNIE